jgi:photosystem II stability/assembly factor-like uncharacterized protein
VWNEQSNGTDYWLSSVSFIDPDHGISCGGYDNFLGIGIIKRTTDGGETWSSQTIGSGWIADVYYIDTDYVFAISNFQSSIILNSSDGGETWSNMDTLAYSYAISFINSDIGTDVGVGGFISRTTNGGANWTLQSSGIMKILYSVSFTDLNYGTVVGDSGIILRTTNGGEDWIIQLSGIGETLFSVSFVDENNGLAVGENGTILRTTNGGGITEINEDNNDLIPNDFVLSQNYPNPFNPSTKIRYTIPNVIASGAKQSQLVTLKVYDVLGNEMATLINEEKPAGSYEVDFNSAGFSSGIYFYTIQAGSYTQTKKMILLR